MVNKNRFEEYEVIEGRFTGGIDYTDDLHHGEHNLEALFDDDDPTLDVPRAHLKGAVAYTKEHPPTRAEMCLIHGYVDCSTCRLPCPICGTLLWDGHAHSVPPPIPQEAPIRSVSEAWTPKTRKPKVKRISKGKVRPPAAEITEDIKAELISSNTPMTEEQLADEAFIKSMLNIARKAAWRNVYSRSKESNPDFMARIDDATQEALVGIWINKDKLTAIEGDGKFALAKRMAKCDVMDWTTTAYQRHEQSASRTNPRHRTDDFGPDREALDGAGFDIENESKGVWNASSHWNAQAANPNREQRLYILHLRTLLDNAVRALPKEEALAFNVYLNPSWLPKGDTPRTHAEVARVMTAMLNERKTVDQVRYLLEAAKAYLFAYLSDRLPIERPLGVADDAAILK